MNCHTISAYFIYSKDRHCRDKEGRKEREKERKKENGRRKKEKEKEKFIDLSLYFYACAFCLCVHNYVLGISRQVTPGICEVYP